MEFQDSAGSSLSCISDHSLGSDAASNVDSESAGSVVVIEKCDAPASGRKAEVSPEIMSKVNQSHVSDSFIPHYSLGVDVNPMFDSESGDNLPVEETPEGPVERAGDSFELRSQFAHAEILKQSLSNHSLGMHAHEIPAVSCDSGLVEVVPLHANACDVPPLPSTELLVMSLSNKLLKTRIFHERLKTNFGYELDAQAALEAEEQQLRAKIARQVSIIEWLSKKGEETSFLCQEAEKYYRIVRENLRALETSIAEVTDSLTSETARFNACTVKLNRVRALAPKLELELTDIAQQCGLLIDGVNQGKLERARLEAGLARLAESKSSPLITASTQTIVKFSMLEEIENMQRELEAQLGNMKKARETIQLVRRCT